MKERKRDNEIGRGRRRERKGEIVRVTEREFFFVEVGGILSIFENIKVIILGKELRLI